MSAKDPFSTPARRRRIIADFSKRVLRAYCITACRNVHRLRVETAAAVLLQCSVRSMLARRQLKLLLWRKRTAAAITLQTALRSFIARLLVARLRAQRLKRWQRRLARHVETLWYARKVRLFEAARELQRRNLRLKRQNVAAVNIQRQLRGFWGRKRFRELFLARQTWAMKQHQAALRMQCAVRQWEARTLLRRRKYRKWALKVVAVSTKNWWERRRKLKHRSAVQIQRIIRGYLGRCYAARMKEFRLQQERVPTPIPSPPKPQIIEKSTIVQIELQEAFLRDLQEQGPTFAMLWALENHLLQYSNISGYSLGSLLRKVVSSVNHALKVSYTDNDVIEDMTSSMNEQKDEVQYSTADRLVIGSGIDEDEVQQEQQLILLPKSDVDAALQPSDAPDESQLPVQWGDVCNEIEGLDVLKMPEEIMCKGAEVVLKSCKENCTIEIVVRTVQAGLATYYSNEESGAGSNIYTQTTVILELRPSHNALDAKDVDISPHSMLDMKFHFRDALVLVTEPQEEDNTEPYETIESEPIDQTLPSRPSTAVVKVMLEPSPIPSPNSPSPSPSPVASPVPIDFDYCASIIQSAARRRLQFYRSMVMLVQRMIRRRRRLRCWQNLVERMASIAQYAALIIQTYGRRLLARQRTAALRKRKRIEDFQFGHNFAENEKRNWEAFGFTIPPVNPRTADVAIAPALSIEVADIYNTLKHSSRITDASNHIDKENVAAFVQQNLNHAVEMLQLMDFSPPPPGCVVPSHNHILCLMQSDPRFESIPSVTSGNDQNVDDIAVASAAMGKVDIYHTTAWDTSAAVQIVHSLSDQHVQCAIEKDREQLHTAAVIAKREKEQREEDENLRIRETVSRLLAEQKEKRMLRRKHRNEEAEELEVHDQEVQEEASNVSNTTEQVQSGHCFIDQEDEKKKQDDTATSENTTNLNSAADVNIEMKGIEVPRMSVAEQRMYREECLGDVILDPYSYALHYNRIKSLDEYNTIEATATVRQEVIVRTTEQLQTNVVNFVSAAVASAASSLTAEHTEVTVKRNQGAK